MTESTQTQLNNIKTHVLDPKAVNFSALQTYRILVFTLAFVLVVSIAAIYQLAAKQQLIVRVNDQGIPEVLKIQKDKQITDFVSMPLFIRTYLDYLFNWNQNTYTLKCSLILPLMAPDLRKEFSDEQIANDYLDAIKVTNTISNITVLSVIDKVIPYKDGFITEAKTIKTRIIKDHIDSEVMSTFQIAYRKVTPTPDNIWGYQVFMISEFKEGDVKGEIK